MALADLSFKLYTDSGLVSEFSGLYQLTHETDLSDNPQDFVLYFGSNASSTVLQASSNPGVDNIVLTPTDVLAEWTVNTAYALGYTLEPTTPNTYYYRCTTAGTSHATTEPTWPTAAIGDTVTDGTVVWTLIGKKHPETEIKLALSSGALGAATGGASLSLGSSIDSGVGNAVPVYIRITNTVTTVQSNTGYPNIGVYINGVVESEA